MSKREAQLKSAFTRELKRQCPDYVILLSLTAGAPDRCITGNGKTTYWEMKHATPTFQVQGLQAIMCGRLEKQGFCRFVIWWENRFRQRTLIIRPSKIRFLIPDASCEGFDMVWLVSYVKRVHEGIDS